MKIRAESKIAELPIQKPFVFLDQCCHLLVSEEQYTKMTLADVAAACDQNVSQVIKAAEHYMDLAKGVEMTDSEVQEMQDQIVWVDVRQSWEWQQRSLPGSVWIWEQPLKVQLEKWQTEGLIPVLISNQGERSFVVAMGWRNNGYPQVRSLSGGLQQRQWQDLCVPCGFLP